MRVPIKIGGCTLIGVNKYKPIYDKNGKWLRNVVDHSKFPLSHGNCFDLMDPQGKSHRVVNFCYENLVEWMERSGQKNIEVQCIPKSDRLWEICDARIPKEWYSKDYCTVCTPLRMLPFEQRKRYLKGKTFKKVYDKGGTWWLITTEEVRSKTGILTVPWTIETNQDLKAFYSKDAEKALLTKYATKVVNPDFYGKITIEGEGSSPESPKK